MNKQQQDLTWACLPTQVRWDIKKHYTALGDSIATTLELLAYEDLFGKHNLTSDTEPAELLFVERKEVQEYKAEIEYTLAGSFSSEYSKGYWRGQQTALDRLFGDKCLPESVQGEPKFKLDYNMVRNTEPKKGTDREKQGNFSEFPNQSQKPSENCDSENLNSICVNMEQKE